MIKIKIENITIEMDKESLNLFDLLGGLKTQTTVEETKDISKSVEKTESVEEETETETSKKKKTVKKEEKTETETPKKKKIVKKEEKTESVEEETETETPTKEKLLKEINNLVKSNVSNVPNISKEVVSLRNEHKLPKAKECSLEQLQELKTLIEDYLEEKLNG